MKKDRERKQRQWEKENTDIQQRRKLAPSMKAALRAKGCNLPFYEILDSAEEEYKKIVAWAKTEFRSLHEVYEIDGEVLKAKKRNEWLKLPVGWEQIIFDCDDSPGSDSYNEPDEKANLRGATTAYRDATGALHTVVEVVKNPVIDWEHKEYKYLFKIPVLLHELGHVKDQENKIHFDADGKRVNIIEAEVYANTFALEECYKRACFMSAGMLYDSLAGYRDDKGYRGEIVRRLLERFKIPQHRQWMDYDINGG